MEFIWFSMITLWQWHQSSQILFIMSEILLPQLPSCDLLTSGACQMGFQFGWDADLSCSTWQMCPSHLQLGAKDVLHCCGTQAAGKLVLPDMVQVDGDGVISRLAGSWQDEGLIKWRWMCYTGCIDRVQGSQFQLLDTNWKLKFSFSIQTVLAPVCCFWYTR